MKFNNVELTQDSIMKARQFYIDLAERCIRKAERGEWLVNYVPSYVADMRRRIARMQHGDEDYTLTFLQRAYYIQTGDDVALLP